MCEGEGRWQGRGGGGGGQIIKKQKRKGHVEEESKIEN